MIHRPLSHATDQSSHIAIAAKTILFWTKRSANGITEEPGQSVEKADNDLDDRHKTILVLWTKGLKRSPQSTKTTNHQIYSVK
jgi:hypothetical protein